MTVGDEYAVDATVFFRNEDLEVEQPFPFRRRLQRQERLDQVRPAQFVHAREVVDLADARPVVLAVAPDVHAMAVARIRESRRECVEAIILEQILRGGIGSNASSRMQANPDRVADGDSDSTRDRGWHEQPESPGAGDDGAVERDAVERRRDAIAAAPRPQRDAR
ncbi:MAG: hypothetical protein U1F20_07935 [Lysobacterales bacterium]